MHLFEEDSILEEYRVNPKELKEIVEQFDRTSVLVIGDLMLDKFIYGTVSRISPEAPVPVIDVTRESFRLGGAANAISNMRVLGGNVTAVGVVGDDWYGRRLIGLLKQEGVDTECVIICKDRPTTVKTRVIAGDQHIVRIDREKKDAIDYEYTQTILDFLNEKIDSIDALLVSDYDKGVVTNRLLESLIPLAKKSSKPIIAHPKVEHFLDYKGVTMVITNLERASIVTGIRQINETSIRNMGNWLLTHLECEHVLITREKDGMSLFEKNGSITHIPAVASEVRNVTGAGDAVSSLIALSLATRATTMINSAILANIAAGIVIEKSGAARITGDELKSRIENITGCNLYAECK
ncbi:MAG: PfkB family carbohydrate kinase [Candidatus Methanoperedens sp.]